MTIETIINSLKVRKIFYIPILIVLLFGYITSSFSENIEVHHVYKILPAFVIYTENIKAKFSGTTQGMIVFIHPEFRGNKEVLEHELMHVQQGYRYGFQSWIFMLRSDKMFVNMEAEAYALHIQNENEIPFWADFIKEEYESSASMEEIEGYIRYYWKKQRGF